MKTQLLKNLFIGPLTGLFIFLAPLVGLSSFLMIGCGDEDSCQWEEEICNNNDDCCESFHCVQIIYVDCDENEDCEPKPPVCKPGRKTHNPHCNGD